MPARKSQGSRASSKAQAAEDEVYTIDHIVDYKEDADGPKWRIRWKNYSAKDDTWEPVENILTDDKKIKADMQRLQSKKEGGGTAEMGGRSPASHKKTTASVSPSRRKSATRKSASGRTAKAPETSASRVIKKFVRGSRTHCEVAHVRRYRDRDDDYECTIVYNDGETVMMPVSETRVKYPDELFDYLLKRIKFVDN